MARLGYCGAVTQRVGDKILFFSYKPQVFETEKDIKDTYDVVFKTAEESPKNWRYWWDSWLVKQERGEV